MKYELVNTYCEKCVKLRKLQQLFWNSPKELFTTPSIAASLEISEDTALRYLNLLSVNGGLPLVKQGRFWALMEE